LFKSGVEALRARDEVSDVAAADPGSDPGDEVSDVAAADPGSDPGDGME